jgi:hypothetical protein
MRRGAAVALRRLMYLPSDYCDSDAIPEWYGPEHDKTLRMVSLMLGNRRVDDRLRRS